MTSEQLVSDLVVGYAVECVDRICDVDLYHARLERIEQFIQTASRAVNRAEAIRREREDSE
jgi:hypothetical protein